MRRPPTWLAPAVLLVVLLGVLLGVTVASLAAAPHRDLAAAQAARDPARATAPPAGAGTGTAPHRAPAEGTAAPGPHAYGPAVPPVPSRAAVDAAGAPAAGHDPASQRQVGLAEAAAQAQGLGFDVADAGGRPAPPAPAPTGGETELGGCSPAYGTPGQCVPVQPPQLAGMAMAWDCATLRGYFPDGVRVRGEDPWHLDADHDGTACGRGDG